MSPQCPKCGTSLKDDYGMASCPTCGSIVFIDMEGNAFIGSSEPAAPADPTLPPQEAPVAESEAGFSSFDNLGGFELPAQTPEAGEAEASSHHFADIAPAAEAGSSDPIPDGDGINDGFDDGFNMDAFMDPASVPSTTASEGKSTPDLSPVDDPLGINSYANSEVSSAKDGLLVFKIFISGIDSKELRESIREAVEDSRFGWDSADLINQISKGHLTIENLAPVKAVILVNRIKRLPVKIRWEQYAITQMDGP